MKRYKRENVKEIYKPDPMNQKCNNFKCKNN